MTGAPSRGVAMFSISGCFGQAYDARLVALAAFICVIACFTTVNLMARAQLARGRRGAIWLGAAALIFGSGVWSLHFVAMLAFMPGFPIAYDLVHTVRSIIFATVGAGLAFGARELFDRKAAKILFAGVFLGCGIAAMHYEGVAAMRLPGATTFDMTKVWLSICIGIGFSLLAFWRASELSGWRRKAEVSGLIGLAVLGVHFVGMSALTVTPGALRAVNGAVLGSGSLAVAVGSISVAIVIAGMAAVLTDRRLSLQSRREANRFRQLADASFEGIVIHCDGVVADANETFAKMVGCGGQGVDRPSDSRFRRQEGLATAGGEHGLGRSRRPHRVRTADR